MTMDGIKNADINMNEEIIHQMKLMTRENGISWLANTCKIILTELVKPNEINICISLCKIKYRYRCCIKTDLKSL